MDPLPGDRVVVRYRLGTGGPDDWRAVPNPAVTRGPALSDLTGILLSATAEELVVERDGVAEHVPAAAITSVRQLSVRVVRNSAIRAVERTLTDAAEAAERTWIDGWLVSAGPDPAAVRATSAVPLLFGASAAALDGIRAWYAGRDLPARVVVADRLLRPSQVSASPGTGYEVLLGPDGTPVEVPESDQDERLRLRADGFGLHHTVRVLDL